MEARPSAPASPLLLCSVAELPELTLDALMRDCRARLQAGERLLSLFGHRAVGELAVLSALFLRADGHITVLRAEAEVDAPYPSLTPAHPALHIFERELHEQTGLVPLNHPWLKPVRFAGALQQKMADYPFFQVRGAEVHEVGVGPIHAGVIEPGHFRFMCLGESVHHLEIQLGYQHRDVETLLLATPPSRLTPLVESIAGDTCIANTWAYCAAIEALAGLAPDPVAERVRGVALELERIAIHLATLSGMANDIAFLQGSTSYGRLRTAIINASMRVCGSRFGRGWLRPGGVRYGISAERRADLLQTLKDFATDLAQVHKLMRGSRGVMARLRGVGQLPPKAAAELGLWGVVARASGLAVDTRCSLPGGLYSAHPIEQQTETTADCAALFGVRVKEIDASLDWLNRVLSVSELEPAPLTTTLPALRADQFCVSLREGPRGPVLHALETGHQGQLLHYRVQDPSLQNWFALALALRDNDISDFPICNKSFDLSYCGNDL